MKNQKIIKYQSGQVNILAVIGIVVSISLATIGGYFAQTVRTDEKINSTNTEVNLTKERTARLEADSITVKEDLRVIKADIKELLKRVK